MAIPPLTQRLKSHTVIFHYTVLSKKCGLFMNRTHYKFNNHLDIALFLKSYKNTSANKEVIVSKSYTPLYSIMQQSQYFYIENSLWSYFSTKSFFMHQISRIYSHKFGLYLRYTVIVQHFTALCSKLGIFMNRTHRDSIFLLKLHLFPNFWSLVPICHLSLYGAPSKN